MSPTERPLAHATIDHVALSVADLDAMVAFYHRLGFDETVRSDFAPAPIRSALLRNSAGAVLEIAAHERSEPGASADSASDAARHRGLFHYAVAVAHLEATVIAAVAAGARPVSAPTINSRGDARFAYVADPEGNLIELVAPLAGGPQQRQGRGGR